MYRRTNLKVSFAFHLWSVLHCVKTLYKKWSFPWRISSVNVTKSVFGHFSRSTELWLEHLELHDKLYSSRWTIYSNNLDLYVICFDLLFVSVSQRIWLIKFTRFINMFARKENSAHFLLITKIFITILR